MRTLFLCLILTLTGWSEEWTQHLSPRMRTAFGPMLRSDWDPRKEVELTPQERREFEQVWMPRIRELRERMQQPVERPPQSTGPASEPQLPRKPGS